MVVWLVSGGWIMDNGNGNGCFVFWGEDDEKEGGEKDGDGNNGGGDGEGEGKEGKGEEGGSNDYSNWIGWLIVAKEIRGMSFVR